MKKLGRVVEGGKFHGWIFHCPGCGWPHVVDDRWVMTGDEFRPTFSPSFLSKGVVRCHSFVVDGQIRYLKDCTHELAGQTIEIPDWDGWGGY